MSKFHTANVSVGLGRYHTSAVYQYQLLTGAPDTNTKPAVTVFWYMYCIADNTHGRQCSIWGVLGASKIFCVGAQIEAPKGPMGRVWGGGIPLPSRLKGLGERRELPQRGPGPGPQTLFKHILGSQNGSGTGKICDILPNVKQNFVIFLAWYRHFLTA